MNIAPSKHPLAQYRVFMGYRYLAYNQELKQLLLQLKSFGLLFLVVLGSSMLGLILLLFLGLGKIIDSSAAPQYGAQMALFYLLLQSVMFSAMKSAIKNSQQRLFQQTIARSVWLYLVDIKLLTLSNAWLIASVLIALDLTLSQWVKVPHFVVFMLLQFSLGVLCIYKPSALIYGFIFSTILVCVPIYMQPLTYHIGFALLFTLSLFVPVVNVNGRIAVSSIFGFWFCYLLNHSWVLVWRVSLLLCIFMASAALINERADLVPILVVLTMAFIVLFSSSLQFDCGKVHEQYRLFFKTCQRELAFYISQFLPSLLLFLVATISYSVIFGHIHIALFFIGNMWCVIQVYFAQKKPAHYALVWLILAGLMLALLN
ncbi:hypothetical protein FHG08_09230 [Pseudoalteromonas sp. Scap03]|uniref:DUF6136 family protein n=1 Tax=unclassified Pseudoalteromonas TaxID=194690 RepID=UPI0015B91CC6|nr:MULTISPECIES: DUF6136 family protein [unclassified Pseudoalteromonas]NWL15898.1 hypothetical protein [Pseudoalteromonas sp. Scap03]QLE81038.1 hypothetical protein FLM54_05500 [Pseudoalteromonas sp. Scap25]QLE88981.1 hypothetical protein FLM47_05495 [Pseudoalteromonas sp. Scap06]